MNIALVSILAFLGVYLLATGLRGVIGKKPFLFSSKINFWLVALAFAPGTFQAIFSVLELHDWSARKGESFDWSFVSMMAFPLLVYPLLLAFLWRQMSGYTVLGVTDESFRQALCATLDDMRLPFEERLSRLHLTSIGADLQANVAGWVGTATIRVKQAEHRDTLDRVAEGLRAHFAGSHLAINMFTCVFYIATGALVLGSAVLLASFMLDRGFFD